MLKFKRYFREKCIFAKMYFREKWNSSFVQNISFPKSNAAVVVKTCCFASRNSEVCVCCEKELFGVSKTEVVEKQEFCRSKTDVFLTSCHSALAN